MDLKHIRSFVEIVKNKSFSKAAENLYITQPTISNHISKLEKDLKTNLLVRNSREVDLTEQGKLFYKYALNIIQMEKNLRSQLNDYENNIAGKLKIMASTVPEKYFLIHLINKFHQKYPEVNFNIKRSDSQKTVEAIKNSAVDFGIIGTNLLDDELIYESILEDEIILVGNEKHYSSIDEIDFDDIYGEKIISREKGSGTRKEVECFFNHHGYNYDDLNIKFTFESNDSIMKLVSESNYLTFISKKVFEDEKYSNKDIKHIKLPDKIDRFFILHIIKTEYYLHYLKNLKSL